MQFQVKLTENNSPANITVDKIVYDVIERRKPNIPKVDMWEVFTIPGQFWEVVEYNPNISLRWITHIYYIEYEDGNYVVYYDAGDMGDELFKSSSLEEAVSWLETNNLVNMYRVTFHDYAKNKPE